MSVGILNDTSFGNVLKTLCSPSIRIGTHEVRLGTAMGLGFANPLHIYEFDKLRDAVRLFVQRCIFFNHEAYRLRYGGSACEPITSEQLDGLERVGKVVSLAQVFKSLHCIDYNSDITDYIDIEDYPLRETFEEWKKTMECLTNEVAQAIAWKQSDAEKCVWF